MTRLVLMSLCGLLVAVTGQRPAMACACGGVVTTSGAAVDEESSFIWFSGTQEQVDLSMSLDGSASDAAWIMPVAPNTTVSLGDAERVRKARAASQPEVRERQHWRLVSMFSHAHTSSSVPERVGAARVDSVMRVGPFTVTQLSGTDAGDVNTWLAAHHYPTRPALVPDLQHYLGMGWHIDAVKLTPTDQHPADQLPPLRMSFPATTLVYPMRLSHHARSDQMLAVYVAAPHRMAISSQPAPHAPMQLAYAGRQDAAALGLPSDLGQVFLTSYTASLLPASIANDLSMVPAHGDDAYRQVEYDDTWTNLPIEPLAVLLVLAVVGIGWLLRRRRPKMAGRR